MNIQNICYDKINVTGGFWQQKQQLVRKTTIWNVYKRFKETGRFDAFKQQWKEGEPNKPHIFWDSDIAKWLESVAYLTLKEREPELEAIVDEVVSDIEKNQWDDGYYNSYFQLVEPENRFTVRGHHELYCLGHLIEAAVAYDRATGKNKLLQLMEKYTDLVYRIFVEEKSAAFDSPGHEEIELALVRLYEHTDKKKYLDLALHFINKRGSLEMPNEKDKYLGSRNIQDHLPVREQTSAEGHAVRACYLYCAMADLAQHTGDRELERAVKSIFNSIVNRKMYITGAIGSTRVGEAFEEDYRLPNDTAYGETCAAIALALFAKRMQLLDPENSVYADTVERVIYNGFLSGMSLDGKAFFYVNSQEIDLNQRKYAEGYDRKFPITQRVEVFNCSCCPPNVTRFIPLIAELCYTYTDDTVFVNQYMETQADLGDCKITQKTNYPFEGKVILSYEGGKKTLALRKPYWCGSFTVNGKKLPCKNGYVYVDADGNAQLEINMEFELKYIFANTAVRENRGCTALTYGPFVYCMEGVDNGESLGEVMLACGKAKFYFDSKLSLPCFSHPAIRKTIEGLYSDKVKITPINAKFIPYFAYANRGETDMRLWVSYK